MSKPVRKVVTYRTIAVVERSVTVECDPDEAAEKALKQIDGVDKTIGPSCWKPVELKERPQLVSVKNPT